MKPTHKHMCAKCSGIYICKKRGAILEGCKRYQMNRKGSLCWDCRKVPS